MKFKLFAIILSILFGVQLSFSQSVTLEGYAFEKGNRGYLNVVKIEAFETLSNKLLGETFSEIDGKFVMELPANTAVTLVATKDMFEQKKVDVEIGTTKAFVKLEMGRSSGYYFDVTLAEKRDNENQVVDAIKGGRIEVYNNTTKEEIMDLKDHPNPEFRLNLLQGNHYTILVRKEGYLSKRMEVYVNVKGCILCFEGVGSVQPGVSDNLTEGNDYGVLLANVEMEKIFEGKTMEIQNLYYDLNKWDIKKEAEAELKKVIVLMQDNPNLLLELGAHTDSRGTDEDNMQLSEKRAKSAVDYLRREGNIGKERLIYSGYGETQITNKCRNGVQCTEAEHAVNRRTELKILGITRTAEEKSLARMKNEEQMEGMIEELMNQESIKVKDEEELKSIIESEKNKQGNQKPTYNSEAERIKAEQKALMDKKNQQKTLGHTDKIGNDSPVMHDVESIPATNKLIERGKDENGLPIYDKKFTKPEGYKIIITQSPRFLAYNHPIHREYPNIEIWPNEAGKVYYMIPGGDTTSSTLELFNKLDLTKYKGSFVAKFDELGMTKIDQ